MLLVLPELFNQSHAMLFQHSSDAHDSLNTELLNFCFFVASLEPVGSVAPKVNSYSKFDEITVRHGHTLSILCPAQSFPVPAFR